MCAPTYATAVSASYSINITSLRDEEHPLEALPKENKRTDDFFAGRFQSFIVINALLLGTPGRPRPLSGR